MSALYPSVCYISRKVLHWLLLRAFRNTKFTERFFVCADETVYNGTCTQAANTCTYPNALCGDDGLCGCETGLEYNETLEGCCMWNGNL